MTTLPILTVSQLNRQVRTWLEQDLGLVHVEGEISNFSQPASGHFYFSLKDSTAQLRCVYFRNKHASNHSTLKNGQQIIASGLLSLYEARGDYQLIVERVQEAGEGDLYKQFELLKTKLLAQGLFESARKKNIPTYPHIIGVITSPTGAALRDILSTLARRFPLAEVIVYSSEVQGKQAAIQLLQAIKQANFEKRCHVLILARGGGSIEDLWAFNDERLAYAIAESNIPIVSGVGHETDFTIADFVADVRAATPTAAAETITPNWLDLMAGLVQFEQRLCAVIRRKLQHNHLMLHHERQKIASPKYLIRTYWQTLDYLKTHLFHSQQRHLQQRQQNLFHLLNKLHQHSPEIQRQQAEAQLKQLKQRLIQQFLQQFNTQKQRFATALATLEAVSPLATLQRGYAIALHDKKVVVDSQQVNVGDTLVLRLAKGSVRSQIISKE